MQGRLHLILIFTIFGLLIPEGHLVVGKLEKLILTDFIESGNVDVGRNLSKVHDLGPVLSYSGFITVDKGCNSNLFFWFFPAAYEREEAPLILWHGGGPGSSGLFGLFVENGPYFVDDGGQLHLRETSWALAASVIYLDSPVGSGFSEPDRDECHVQSTKDAAKGAYEFMKQFFKLFPEFTKNELFIFSGSYGGKFAPAIAYEIHQENHKTGNSQMNLKGISITSGFTDPINQINYSEFYYSQGLIDKHERDYFGWQEMLAKEHIRKERWTDAFNIIEPLIIGTEFPSRLKNVTGLGFPYNLMSNAAGNPSFMTNHVEFLNQEKVRRSLHVDMSKTFANSNNRVYTSLKEDIYKSVKPLLEELLESRLYRICIASAQLDLIVPHTTIARFVDTLRWKSREAFRSAQTKIWRTKAGAVGGYLKNVDGLTYLFIRNAGHIWIKDQPQISLEIMRQFTRGLLS